MMNQQGKTNQMWLQKLDNTFRMGTIAVLTNQKWGNTFQQDT